MSRKPMDAKKALKFIITDEHVKRAVPKCPGQCVVAQALKDTVLGEFIEGVQVGSLTTLVYTTDKVLRYTTPNKLRVKIPVFDATGEWHLPPGDYTLLPYAKRPRRWESAKRWGGVQDRFRGRAMPSRHIIRMSTLCAA